MRVEAGVGKPMVIVSWNMKWPKESRLEFSGLLLPLPWEGDVTCSNQHIVSFLKFHRLAMLVCILLTSLQTIYAFPNCAPVVVFRCTTLSSSAPFSAAQRFCYPSHLATCRIYARKKVAILSEEILLLDLECKKYRAFARKKGCIHMDYFHRCSINHREDVESAATAFTLVAEGESTYLWAMARLERILDYCFKTRWYNQKPTWSGLLPLTVSAEEELQTTFLLAKVEDDKENKPAEPETRWSKASKAKASKLRFPKRQKRVGRSADKETSQLSLKSHVQLLF